MKYLGNKKLILLTLILVSLKVVREKPTALNINYMNLFEPLVASLDLHKTN